MNQWVKYVMINLSKKYATARVDTVNIVEHGIEIERGFVPLSELNGIKMKYILPLSSIRSMVLEIQIRNSLPLNHW
ncbi:hypothetical protein A9Q99_18105 [Gammaproteobacteria bacterium 45_16_T64]|nr:hypothetical protein A9Q99_18105 [Gammaproteobacteria bacterium 45_16_T64]